MNGSVLYGDEGRFNDLRWGKRSPAGLLARADALGLTHDDRKVVCHLRKPGPYPFLAEI